MSYDEVGDYIRSFQRGEIAVNSVPTFPRPPVRGPVAPHQVAARRPASPEVEILKLETGQRTTFLDDEGLRNLLKITSPLSDGSLVYTKVRRNFISVTHFYTVKSRKQRRQERGYRLGFIKKNGFEPTGGWTMGHSTTYHFAKPGDRYFTTSVALNSNTTESIDQVCPKADKISSRFSVRTTKGARQIRPLSSEISGITQWRYVPVIINDESSDWTDLNYELTPWSLAALSKISSSRGIRDHFFFDV